MADGRRDRDLVAWAWAVGWTLASMGFVISDVYSSPHRDVSAAYVLGFVGWAVGAIATVRCVRRLSDSAASVIVVATAGWALGASVGVVAGLVWLEAWDAGYWGPILGAAIGGAIGGGFTLPIRAQSAPTRIVRRGVVSALNWGTSFLVFQVLAFYAGYILMQMTVDPLVPILGHIGAKVPGWVLPAGLGGWAAARLASRSLQAPETAAV